MRLARLATLPLVLSLLPPAGLEAQHSAPPPPAAWALEGVTVVDGTGAARAGMTVVIRRGVVETLRPGAPVPADARRIGEEGDTLHVYPGFVDADGYAGTSPPAPSREGVEAWSPTREVQGFTPGRVAARHLSVDGGDLGEYRKKGVVASLAWPGPGPSPGRVSAILHHPEARTPAGLVVRPEVGLAMSFERTRGAYPGTLFGVHALIRQGFLDAEHHMSLATAYASDPRGLEVAAWDDDLRTLDRVRRRELRVFFRVDETEDIRRVLALADEIGFDPVIVGGHGAGPIAPELASRGVPVLLSLDLPEAEEWDGESAEPLAPAAHRERARLLPVLRAAAALHRAGVPFALTSGGSDETDLLAGVRTAIGHGLPPEAAVAALTRTPAELLGLAGLGRIEEGLAANLIVTDRPIHEEGARILWTFVNGVAERGAR